MSHTIHYPQGNTLLRNLNKNYPVVSHGKGPYLFDTDGKKYFDASGGALVATLLVMAMKKSLAESSNK